MDQNTKTLLDKIASTSPKTIQEAANRSLEPESSPKGPSMGHRTRSMAKRNERARRLLGLVDV